MSGPDRQASQNVPARNVTLRAIAAWGMIIVAEVIHGIARGLFLVPLIGEFRSSQLGVFTGSMIVLAIAYLSVRWIGASSRSGLLWVGGLWVALTVLFEVLFGRFVLGLSWERLLAGYNLLGGGLMPLGLLLLGLSPAIAARLRSGREHDKEY